MCYQLRATRTTVTPAQLAVLGALPLPYSTAKHLLRTLPATPLAVRPALSWLAHSYTLANHGWYAKPTGGRYSAVATLYAGWAMP